MSVDSSESFELLKAVLAMAAVDGRISGNEKALLKALAYRAGVGPTSLDAMIEQARNDPPAPDRLFARALSDPERALQLLVAAAAVDGRFSSDERALLVEIAAVVGVSSERFDDVFRAGLAASKRVRDRR